MNKISLLLSAFLTLTSCNGNGGTTPEPTPTPTPTPTPDPEVGTDADFRLMSFNILQATSETAGHEWASVRKEPCIKMFNDIKPDIVCIQEARKSQCNDLASALPQYSQIKHPKDNIETNGGQRNLILYKPDVFELVSWNKYWFSADLTASGNRFGDDKTTQKLTVTAEFRHKKTGKTIYVYDTHFFANVSTEANRGKCTDISLSNSLGLGVKDRGAAAVVFFCGDLNMEPDNTYLKPMFDYMSHGAKNAKSSDGISKTTYNKFGGSSKVLDHIFYRNAEALTYKVVNSSSYGTQYVSDHYPIYCDFVIK